MTHLDCSDSCDTVFTLYVLLKMMCMFYLSVSMKLKFIDFGSAFYLYEKYKETMVHCCGAGTPEYMAPEVLNMNLI